MEILRNTPEFKPSEIKVAEEVIDSYLNDPVNSGYYILVAAETSGITGYICYGATPMTEGTWDIYWEAVDQTKQGCGIGGALTNEAEKQIRQAGGKQAIIETSSTPTYQRTLRFHSNLGYKIIARIPDFYSPGDDKIILLKRL